MTTEEKLKMRVESGTRRSEETEASSMLNELLLDLPKEETRRPGYLGSEGARER